MSGTRYFDADDVYRLLDLEVAYASQLTAFRCLGEGLSDQAGRLMLAGTSGDATGFCYAARLRPGTGAVCKFGAVAGDNPGRGLPTVHATVLVLDATTGTPAAVMDGSAITERRTAAATAVAVNALTPSHVGRLAILGCGVQGRAHAFALPAVRSFRQVRLWDREPGRAAALAEQIAGARAVDAFAVGNRQECVAESDVVVTCTTSATPVLSAAWVTPGTTVISIGCFDADRHEVGIDMVRRADLVVVDDRTTAMAQAGPIVSAVAERLLNPDAVVELGQLVAHGRGGRQDDHQVVFYNSIGIGVQDAAAALAILERANGGRDVSET